MTHYMKLYCKRATLTAIGLCLLLGSTQAKAGLVAQWHFDETSGSVANASVGAINGVLTGSAVFVAGGISANAVSLDRSANGLVNFGDNFGFASGSYTVSVWALTADTIAAVPVAKHEIGTGNGYIMSINDIGDGAGTPTGKTHFYHSDNFSGNSSVSVNDLQWHHLVGIYDAVNHTVSQYIDGLPSGSSFSTGMTPNSAPLLVGGVQSSGNPTGSYTGLVDELMLFDHALSANEVSYLFANPSGIPEPSAVLLLGVAGLAALRRR